MPARCLHCRIGVGSQLLLGVSKTLLCRAFRIDQPCLTWRVGVFGACKPADVLYMSVKNWIRQDGGRGPWFRWVRSSSPGQTRPLAAGWLSHACALVRAGMLHARRPNYSTGKHTGCITHAIETRIIMWVAGCILVLHRHLSKAKDTSICEENTPRAEDNTSNTLF